LFFTAEALNLYRLGTEKIAAAPAACSTHNRFRGPQANCFFW